MSLRWPITRGDPLSARAARHSFKKTLDGRRLGAQAVDLEIAFGELISNAIKYGCDPISASVRFRGNVLSIHVEDAGLGFELEGGHAVKWSEEGGRGLNIVRALSDTMSAERTKDHCFRVAATFKIWDAPFGVARKQRSRIR